MSEIDDKLRAWLSEHNIDEVEALVPDITGDAPEVEFYLVEKNINSDNRLRPPIGRSGGPEGARQSCSIDALSEFEPLFAEMNDFCETMELDPECA